VPTKLLISDANILIDMEVGRILERMFELDLEFAVPDTLFHDELSDRHARLPDSGLLILELSSTSIQYTVQLVQRYRHLRVSRNDFFAIALARQERCPLLTGDADLRVVCDEQQVEVHGTVWLMEQMFSAGLITFGGAQDAYARMREQNRRLPRPDIQAQLRRFRKS
jgi:predicted nucleic acid-binding protein